MIKLTIFAALSFAFAFMLTGCAVGVSPEGYVDVQPEVVIGGGGFYGPGFGPFWHRGGGGFHGGGGRFHGGGGGGGHR